AVAWHLRRTQYLDRRARVGVHHQYAVRACNALGCSYFSKDRTVGPVPTTPTGVNAVPAGPVRVAVSWRAAWRASRYRLYRNGTLVKQGIVSTSTIDAPVAP